MLLRHALANAVEQYRVLAWPHGQRGGQPVQPMGCGIGRAAVKTQRKAPCASRAALGRILRAFNGPVIDLCVPGHYNHRYGQIQQGYQLFCFLPAQIKLLGGVDVRVVKEYGYVKIAP